MQDKGSSSGALIPQEQWSKLAPLLRSGSLPQPFERELFLFECRVAGTCYADGIFEKTSGLAAGDILELRREPRNRHDPLAVAVMTAAGRIGYLPRSRNEIPSRLMDGGKMLFAEVAYIRNLGELPDCYWADIGIKVFMRDF